MNTPRYTSEVNSVATLAAAAHRQATHEIAECPKCHGAVHPLVLANMGQCTSCLFAAQREAVSA